VKPYPHTFQTHAKQRWLGRPILSVLSEEFLAYSPEYFKYAIQAGKIRINGHPVSEDYAIRNSDFLEH
jgi:tRNA pseudouridine synthase 9